MKLYHYSSERYTVLKTKRKQLKVTEKDRIEAAKHKDLAIGPYYDHISFFFDPIPAKHMGYFFKGVPHEVWRKGAMLYEYVVETDDFNFGYEIVETEADYKQLITEWPTTPSITKEQIRQFKVNRFQRKLKTNETAKTKENFLKMANPYVGKLLENYKKAQRRYELDAERMKYAALVPHVMLYPDNGYIEYESAKRIRIDDVPVK